MRCDCLKGKYRGKIIFSLFLACFCRYVPLKSTQKVLLTKTYFSKRVSADKKRTFKTLPVWAGLARDVDGGTFTCVVCDSGTKTAVNMIH